jgi:hypothetical protein
MDTRSGKTALELKALRVSKANEKMLEAEKRIRARKELEERRPKWTVKSKAFAAVERRLVDGLGGSDVARLKGRHRRFLERLHT